jgi:hypothetical protein
MKYAIATALSVCLLESVHAASVGTPDLSACPINEATFTFFGAANNDPDCSDCTTVTYIDGSDGPANCKIFDKWVLTANSGTFKVIVKDAAGILPGAFWNTNAETRWFDLTLVGSSAPLDTLPAGVFDTYADKIDQIFITSSAPLKISNPSAVFGKKMPLLKTLSIHLPATVPSTGVNAQLLNANLNTAQTLDLIYGNPTIDANLLANLPQLRNVVIFNAKSTRYPAGLFQKNQQVKQIGLGGGAADGSRKTPIKAIPDTIFAANPKLEHVDVKFTTLPAIPATIFAKNPSLTSVNFDSDELTALPETLFSSNPLLREVFLPNNKLTALPATLFSSVENPSELSVYLQPQLGTALTCETAGTAIPEGAQCS